VAGAVQTVPRDINSSGEITGDWYDGHTAHGFIRSPDGSLTTFDEPNGGWIVPDSIQIDGIVAGTYTDGQNVGHGFIRSASGTFTTVDVPGARGTFISCINNNGWIVGGWSANADGTNPRGFIRTADGKIKKLSIDQATYILLNSINSANVASGAYIDEQNMGHGFIVTP